MNTLRFGLYAGAAWALVSLILVIISLMNGDTSAWVELDFRPLTESVMLVADAFGGESAFSRIILYAETGLPITPVHVALCAIIAFADGFASGFLIALLYNLISIIRENSKPLPAIYFGAATGVVLGISSGLLALTGIEYGLNIQSFDFTVRPVWGIFSALSGTAAAESLETLRRSYIYFPGSYPGALAWAGWGFIDGFIGGLLISFVYVKLKRGAK
ncbi:MAG: hypothetical protein RIG61_11660 [Deltaproteobacteria bacterium]